MAQEDEKGALRWLAHQLRNDLRSLLLRGELGAEETARRRAELEQSLAGVEGLLGEIDRRLARSA